MKPLESTLKQHELRPYSVQRDYRRELLRSTRGASPLSSHGQEIKQENMQLVSVSPFRAVIKVNQDEEEEEDEDEENPEEDHAFEREEEQMMMNSQGFRHQSPIKEDSQIMRGQREQYLQSFGDTRKTPRGSNQAAVE